MACTAHDVIGIDFWSDQSNDLHDVLHVVVGQACTAGSGGDELSASLMSMVVPLNVMRRLVLFVEAATARQAQADDFHHTDQSAPSSTSSARVIHRATFARHTVLSVRMLPWTLLIPDLIDIAPPLSALSAHTNQHAHVHSTSSPPTRHQQVIAVRLCGNLLEICSGVILMQSRSMCSSISSASLFSSPSDSPCSSATSSPELSMHESFSTGLHHASAPDAGQLNLYVVVSDVGVQTLTSLVLPRAQLLVCCDTLRTQHQLHADAHARDLDMSISGTIAPSTASSASSGRRGRNLDLVFGLDDETEAAAPSVSQPRHTSTRTHSQLWHSSWWLLHPITICAVLRAAPPLPLALASPSAMNPVCTAHMATSVEVRL